VVLTRVVLIATAAVVTGCATTVTGTATWPGATLDKVLLKQADFPPGVEYGRIVEEPGEGDNSGGPPGMLSVPQNCSNGLTDVIRANAERGPGAAAKYSLLYGGARIVMTVLTSPLNITELENEANRCQHFNAYFDRDSAPIPITTTRLPSSRPGQLVYQQTMRLQGVDHSVFMSFESIGRMSVFGIAFPAMQSVPGEPPAPKASLPQTFTEIADKQAQRIQNG
jgi:hypothetical protein